MMKLPDHHATPSHRAIWDADSSAGAPAFPSLDQDIEVDVVIVGGGITGIITAAMLAGSGLRVAVLESGRIGMGTTGHSTGNLYATVDQSLHKLAAKWGHERMVQVAQSRSKAIDQIESTVRTYRLDCDFRRQPWAMYCADESGEQFIEQEFQAATKAGLPARITNDLPLPYDIDRALIISDQAQFNPLKYVRSLAKAVASPHCRIIENAEVIAVEEEQGMVRTAAGHTVKANYIVLATHTPKGFNVLHTELGAYREVAIAAPLQTAQLPGGIFWGTGPEKYSTRLVELAGRQYVLMIGEKYKTGQRNDVESAYRALEGVMQARFDVGPVAFRWSAQQYRPADELPYIGSSPSSPRVLIATGFAADGLTYGALAAGILADRITGKPNPYGELYSPRRFTPVKSAAVFLKENLNTAGCYLKDYMKGGDVSLLSQVPCGEGRIVDLDGAKLAVYCDEAHQLHVLSPICTHMKCIVHWNQSERSWDCPCHGSRFSVDGAVLEGPAMSALQRWMTPPAAPDDAATPDI